ncbi:unnamed protein product [Periconia digitata]|uniref:Uncharacterized protein n=1 Tax=Periconia digitata TaxID=1303443 RepID=A0A9W4UTE5_9PLEO|nr:unnamed protein product [Periconia digitata]
MMRGLYTGAILGAQLVSGRLIVDTDMTVTKFAHRMEPVRTPVFIAPEMKVNVSSSETTAEATSHVNMVFTTITDYTTVVPTSKPSVNATSEESDVTSFVRVTVTMKPSVGNSSVLATSNKTAVATSAPFTLPFIPGTVTQLGPTPQPTISEPVEVSALAKDGHENEEVTESGKQFEAPASTKDVNPTAKTELQEHEDNRHGSRPCSSSQDAVIITSTEFSTTTIFESTVSLTSTPSRATRSALPSLSSSPSSEPTSTTSPQRSAPMTTQSALLSPSTPSTPSSNHANLVNTVISADPRCPYPYPGVYCGPDKTTMMTETTKVEPTYTTIAERKKPEKTESACPFLYPGQKGCWVNGEFIMN